MVRIQWVFIFICGLGFAQEGLQPAAGETGMSLLNDRLHAGGWFDFLVADEEQQATYHEVPHVFTFVNGQISQRLRFFAEAGYINAPGARSSLTQWQRVYLEYGKSESMRFRLGQFNTPSGLWKEKHWYILVDANRKPLIASLNYIPMNAKGVELFGRTMTSVGQWEYSVFSGLSEDRHQSHRPGIGGDLSLDLYELLRFGLFHYDYMNAEDSRDPTDGARKASLSYVEWWLVPHTLMLRSEHLSLQREHAQTIDGWYVKLKWQLSKQWYLNLRYDDTEDAKSGEPVDRYDLTGTMGWNPNKRIRTRFEYGKSRLAVGPRANQWSAWVGFVF